MKRRYTAAQIGVLEKLNRRDFEHLVRLKEIVVPDAWSDDELAYSPMPADWMWAASLDKVIVLGAVALRQR